MQRGSTGADFGAAPAGARHRHEPERADRPAVDGKAADGQATGGHGQSPGFGPAWALLAASEPVQYAPVLGIMRPVLKASVTAPIAGPAETAAAEPAATEAGVAGPGDDAAPAGRPPLRADEPVRHPPRPGAARRPVLLGVATVLVAATAGGYFAFGVHRDGGREPTVVAADVVAPRTPVGPAADGPAAVSPAAVRPVVVSPAAAGTGASPAPAAVESPAEVTAATGEADTAEAPPPQDHRSMVRDAQRALADAGLDPGPVDGLMGPKTRAAVIAFQNRIGVDADGEIDAALLQRLTAADRLSDDDIPPAHLPAAPATEPVPAIAVPAADRSTKQELLAAFRSVFGGRQDDPADAPALADASPPAAGISR